MDSPYIQMRKTLRTDPRVASVAARLQRSTAEVIGGLFLLWCLGDEHGETLRGLSKAGLDLQVGIPGFSDALPSEWLQVRVTSKSGNAESSLHLPNYARKNASTERSRTLTRERVRRHREKKKAACNGVTALPPPTDQTSLDQKRIKLPTEPTTEEIVGYARAYCDLAIPVGEVKSLVKEFGTAPWIEALEHLASRDKAKRWAKVDNRAAVTIGLIKRAADGEDLGRQGGFTTFDRWLHVHRESAVCGNGGAGMTGGRG